MNQAVLVSGQPGAAPEQFVTRLGPDGPVLRGLDGRKQMYLRHLIKSRQIAQFNEIAVPPEKEDGDPRCYECGAHPNDLEEYRVSGHQHGLSPVGYVQQEEATMNADGRFWCTLCYVKLDLPAGKPPPLPKSA